MFRTSCLGVSSVSVIASLLAAFTASAQPAEFFDLGTITAPASPPMTEESYDTSSWFDFGGFDTPGETLNVKWARFTIDAGIASPLYLDIDGWIYNPTTDIVLALYDNVGNLLAVDDDQGGFPQGGGAGLSFGSTGERVPFSGNEFMRGQDGPLVPGTYWLALAAGPLGNAVVNPTGWDVASSASFQLGYSFDDTQTYLEIYINAGNTTFPAPPANNDCTSPAIIGEDVGATPAWTGSNFGATEDGTSPCYPNFDGITDKDIWFTYFPSQTGWAQVIASSDRSSSLILTRYADQCGSVPLRCSGGGNFDFGDGTRLAFPVVQGEPIYLAVAGRAGTWAPVTLNIDLLPPPCDIQTPAGAVPESDAFCGDNANNGCNNDPPAGFDTIVPGQVRSGTLWSTTARFDKDFDWYRLSIPSAVTATISFRSQLSMTAAIFEQIDTPDGCFGFGPISATTADWLSPCTLTTSRPGVLVPGEYFLAMTHAFNDGFECGTGYDQYWITVNTEPCDQPSISSQPASTTSCLGGSATFTVAADSVEPHTYEWQWFRTSELGDYWETLYDGALRDNTDVDSATEIAGADTDTLVISNLDLSQIVVRAVVTSCAPIVSESASLTLCAADFNCDGFLDFFDYDEYVGAFEAGDPRADFNGDQFLDFFDYDAFVENFELGC
jgi:hypothetical protein